MNALYLSILKNHQPLFAIFWSFYQRTVLVGCVCVNIQKMSSTNFFLVSILQFSTNEFHAGSDTRCDEENDFDAIFGALFLYHHTRIITPSHSLQLVWASLLSCLLHSYHKKNSFGGENLQNNPSKFLQYIRYEHFWFQKRPLKYDRGGWLSISVECGFKWSLDPEYLIL